VRLHWSYSPRARDELSKLPAHAWSLVTIAEEVPLRPTRLKGALRARLVTRGEDGAWTPLAGQPYVLRGPRGRTLEGTTDVDGVLRHDAVALVAWRLEAGAWIAVVEASGDDAPVDVRLESAKRRATPTGQALRSFDDADDDGPEETHPVEEDDDEPTLLEQALGASLGRGTTS